MFSPPSNWPVRGFVFCTELQESTGTHFERRPFVVQVFTTLIRKDKRYIVRDPLGQCPSKPVHRGGTTSGWLTRFSGFDQLTKGKNQVTKAKGWLTKEKEPSLFSVVQQALRAQGHIWFRQCPKERRSCAQAFALWRLGQRENCGFWSEWWHGDCKQEISQKNVQNAIHRWQRTIFKIQGPEQKHHLANSWQKDRSTAASVGARAKRRKTSSASRGAPTATYFQYSNGLISSESNLKRPCRRTNSPTLCDHVLFRENGKFAGVVRPGNAFK